MSVASLAVSISIADLGSRALGAFIKQFQSLGKASRDVRGDIDKTLKLFKGAAVVGLITREGFKGFGGAASAAGDLQEALIGVKAELMEGERSIASIDAELKRFKATAFEVQAWTPFDEAQIVSLEKELVKAGAKAEEVTGKTGAAAAAAALAVYEGLEPVTSGEALIGIGTPFKVAADEFMSLADLISRSAAASVVGAADIVETSKYAATGMASLGRSKEEMLIMAAMMGQIGIKGSMAGTSMNRFFQYAAGVHDLRSTNGELLKTEQLIRNLRAAYGDANPEELKVLMEAGDDMGMAMEKLGKMGRADRFVTLTDVFGIRGARTALALLNTGKGSYEDMAAAMDRSASLQEKINETMKGFKKQVMALQGTSRSVIADLFIPALGPLTALTAKVNEFWGAIGRAAQEKESIGKAVSGLSIGGLAAGTLTTAGLGVAGLYYGRRALKGAGGWRKLFGKSGGVAGGIAAGKAVEAATGVKSVFVTNWPDGFGGGAASVATEMMGGKVNGWMGKLLGKGKGMLGMLGTTAGGWGVSSLAAGAAGYGVGTGLNKALGSLTGLEGKTGTKWYEGGLGGWLGEKLDEVMHSGHYREMAEFRGEAEKEKGGYVSLSEQLAERYRVGLNTVHDGGIAGRLGEKLNEVVNSRHNREMVEFRGTSDETRGDYRSLSEQLTERYAKKHISLNVKIDKEGNVISDSDDPHTSVDVGEYRAGE